MTHRHKMSLLGDFVDNELPDTELAEVKKLLANSEDLRSEHELLVRLKQLLRQKRAPDPGEAYFDELTRLIEARTVDAGTLPVETAIVRSDPSHQRRMFVRSLVSAAASLFLFFAALTLGSRHTAVYAPGDDDQSGVFLAGAAADHLERNVMDLATVEERSSLRKGIFLLSPPGSIGRLSGLADLTGR